MTLMPGMPLQFRLPMTQEVMGKFRIRFPHPHEMTRLHDTFQPMIDAPITSDAQVATVHAQTGQCVFVLEDSNGELAGSMLLIQLSDRGLAHLEAGGRVGRLISPAWVCRPSRVPSALLVWGLLGRNAWFAGRVLAFSLELARKVYADMPILTYAATPDGARIMDRVGFRSSHVPGLYQLDLSVRKGKRHA